MMLINFSNLIGLGLLTSFSFILLKLIEVGPVAQWSWWAVTSPLWFGLAVVCIVIFLFLAVRETVIIFNDLFNGE